MNPSSVPDTYLCISLSSHFIHCNKQQIIPVLSSRDVWTPLPLRGMVGSSKKKKKVDYYRGSFRFPGVQGLRNSGITPRPLMVYREASNAGLSWQSKKRWSDPSGRRRPESPHTRSLCLDRSSRRSRDRWPYSGERGEHTRRKERRKEKKGQNEREKEEEKKKGKERRKDSKKKCFGGSNFEWDILFLINLHTQTHKHTQTLGLSQELVIRLVEVLLPNTSCLKGKQQECCVVVRLTRPTSPSLCFLSLSFCLSFSISSWVRFFRQSFTLSAPDLPLLELSPRFRLVSVTV